MQPVENDDARLTIERFLATCRQPVLMEPGDDPLPVTTDSFTLTTRGPFVTLECWNDTRNLVRRVRGIHDQRRGRLELIVERFGAKPGTLTLLDLADPTNAASDRRSARLKYRERFRRSLRRQFPDWRLVELSTEQDLQHSLSPSYPRAFLRKGSTGLAAIGAPEDAPSPEGALSFGLVWLDYLRHREPKLIIEGLAIFLPAGLEATTCHRLRYLNPDAARYRAFVCDRGGHEDSVDPREYSNFSTRLEPWRQPLAEGRPQLVEWVERLAKVEGVERRDHLDGSVGLAVRGLEFARATSTDLLFGIEHKHVAGSEAHLREIEQLARGLSRMRNAAGHRANPLYSRYPEAWLESQVRASIETLDATLYPSPVYGQVPQFTAGERSVIDLLAADRDGRLTVIEIKASQDIHLPLQALDYWMRVKWHLDRCEFSGRGYFPGIPLRNDLPRLLLVAPALEYHPTNETVLRYLAREVPVERVGVGLEWKRELRVMFRLPRVTWPSLSSAK